MRRRSLRAGLTRFAVPGDCGMLVFVTVTALPSYFATSQALLGKRYNIGPKHPAFRYVSEAAFRAKTRVECGQDTGPEQEYRALADFHSEPGMHYYRICGPMRRLSPGWVVVPLRAPDRGLRVAVLPGMVRHYQGAGTLKTRLAAPQGVTMSGKQVYVALADVIICST